LPKHASGGSLTSPDRAGPGLFPPLARHELLALACKHPSAADWPVSHRSAALLATAAQRLGIVASIARETVRRWLVTADLRLHRFRLWLHSRDPHFGERMEAIVSLYVRAPQDGLVYCIDERTSMQAKERICPDWPVQPGRGARGEFHYRRHGTITLFGCLGVHSGQVWGQCAQRHRSAEFVAFLRWLIPQLPADKTLHLVLDNLSTHKTGQVRELLAEHEGRVKLHFTPTHGSWLSQIELWFGHLSRRLLRRGSLAGKDYLQARVLSFIALYNETEAHPYKWTYTGQPRAA
jgi:transposase